MAKKDVQDFRIDFIESVARTENLKILRTISSQLEKNSYTLNISNSEILDILEQGIDRVTTLLGDEAKSFGPLNRIKKMSVLSYFEKIAKGYKELEDKKKANAKLEKQRVDFKNKISKYRQKGKFDKVKEFEYKLFCIEFPNENIEKVLESLETLELKKANGHIDDYEYAQILKELKKAKKASDETLKTLSSTMNTENISFYNSVQEDVRNFICYSFFMKNGNPNESPNRFLMTYDGEVKADFEHMLLLYNYLKSVNYTKLNEIKGVLYYVAIEQFFRDLSPFMLTKINGIYLKQSPTEFYSEKYEGYTRRYIPYYLKPNHYKGYVFEPSNLLQQSFIAAIDASDLTVDNMVGKYKNAQLIMKSKENGLFFPFLSLDLENRMMKYILTGDFPLDEMTGEYKNILLNEFKCRRDIFGTSDSFEVMTDMYSRVVKPYALEVLGSYVRTFCYNLANLVDKDMIYIYYVSPERIAIAVREEVTDIMLKEVFPEKFLSNLKLVEKPILEDIVFGEYI